MDKIEYFNFEKYFIDKLWEDFIDDLVIVHLVIDDIFTETFNHCELVNEINEFINEEICRLSELNAPPKFSLNSSKLKICIGYSKYESVRRVANQFGFKEVGEGGNWNIYWTDGFIGPDKMIHLKDHQKINHFPGMIEICRKDLLAKNVNRMFKLFPEEFNIIPKTWCLPTDMIEFQNYGQKNKTKNFILKPEASCQGRGILITQNFKELKYVEGMVCQLYVDDPLLVDDYKFDMRIYVLITSIDPLRIYAYNEGLVRFTTVKYEEPNQTNMSNVFMHLTNYTVQKESENFIKDNEFTGTKRRISVLNQCFVNQGYDIDQIWKDIDDIIIKTIISVHDILRHNYRNSFPSHKTNSACFEILGFDIILDSKLKPLLIEVNHSPSFHTDSILDREVKDALLWDTFQILQLKKINRKSKIENFENLSKRLSQRSSSWSEVQIEDCNISRQQIFEYELDHIGNFRLLYFTENSEIYNKYITHHLSLFHETAAYRARLKCARKIRNDIQKQGENMKKGIITHRLQNCLSLNKTDNYKRSKVPTAENEGLITKKLTKVNLNVKKICPNIKSFPVIVNNESKGFTSLGDIHSYGSKYLENDICKSSLENTPLAAGDTETEDSERNDISANFMPFISVCESNIHYYIQSVITKIRWHVI